MQLFHRSRALQSYGRRMGEATLGRAGAPPLRYTYWTKSAEVSFRLTCRQSGNRKHRQENGPRWSAVPAPGPRAAWGVGVGVGCMCFVQHSSQSGAERLSHFSFIFTQKTHVQWALTYIPRVRLNPNEQRGTDYRERKNEKKSQVWQEVRHQWVRTKSKSVSFRKGHVRILHLLFQHRSGFYHKLL